MSNINQPNAKHGGCGTRLYRIWKQMRIRCYCKTNPAYRYYGARGIKICNEWKDFSIFRNWALLNGYDDDLTIERRNYNGDYCPENCCWIARNEQSKNTRNTKHYEYQGEILCHNDWARKFGINPSSLTERIQKYGVEKALEMGGKNANGRKRKA